MTERLRWRIFSLLNRSQRVCNASTGCWAAWNDPEQIRGGRWRVSAMCRLDADDNGRCWCGKLGGRSPVGEAPSPSSDDGRSAG